MCGIHFCLGGKKEHKNDLLKKRGPDKTNYVLFKGAHCTFYRLAIVGVEHGDQPFVSGNAITMANGEIYNHGELYFDVQCSPKYNEKRSLVSDCEIIHLLFLMKKRYTPSHICAGLNGEWAFIHYNGDYIYFARDRLGRKPLYYLTDKTGLLVVSSTLEGLQSYKSESCMIVECLPGVLYQCDVTGSVETVDNQQKQVTKIESVPFYQFILKPKWGLFELSYSHFYKLFVNAVKRRVMQADRPVGFLLSGGFDSSLVLSIALKWCKFKQPPHVFTFGFEEKAPDVLAAEKVVRHLRDVYSVGCIRWHKVIGKVEDGLQALKDVVRVVETWDITTIRASTPMFLISKYIAEKTDVKVVLSGEGSDEIFGGYLYFMYAPSDMAFKCEILKLLRELYMFDVRRADRTTAANGLEIRTPFLDDEFLDYFLDAGLCGRNKNMSKELIRDVIRKNDPGLLPEDILNGKKEAFSDAVGYSWKDSIEDFAKKHLKNYMSDEKAEASFYKEMFSGIHDIPKEVVLEHYWLPNQDWVQTGNEPSARVLPIYKN